MHSASDHRRKIKTQVTILIIQIQSINVRINSILRVQITNIVRKKRFKIFKFYQEFSENTVSSSIERTSSCQLFMRSKSIGSWERNATRSIIPRYAKSSGSWAKIRAVTRLFESIVFPRGRRKYEAGPNYGAVHGQLIVGFSTVRHGPRTCIRMQNRYSGCRPRLNIPIRAPSPAIATKPRFEDFFRRLSIGGDELRKV